MNEFAEIVRSLVNPADNEQLNNGVAITHERLQRGTTAFLGRLLAVIERNVKLSCALQVARWARFCADARSAKLTLEFDYFGGRALLCLEPEFAKRCVDPLLQNQEMALEESDTVLYASVAANCLALLAEESLFRTEALSLLPCMSPVIERDTEFVAMLHVQLSLANEVFSFILCCDKIVFSRLLQRAEGLLPASENIQLLARLECAVRGTLRLKFDENHSLLGVSESRSFLALDAERSALELTLRSAAEAKPVLARAVLASKHERASNSNIFIFEVL